MNDEAIFPFQNPCGPRVSRREGRELLIRANRFRNRKENIDVCMQCFHISEHADCKACLLCIQNGKAKKRF